MSAVVQHPRLAEIIARRKLCKRIEAAVSRLIDALKVLIQIPITLPVSCGSVGRSLTPFRASGAHAWRC